MLRPAPFALAASLAVVAPALAEEAVIERIETIEVMKRDFDVPMVITLTAPEDTRIAFEVEADLVNLQRGLPKLVASRVFENCEVKADVRYDDARLVGERLRLDGTLKLATRVCKPFQTPYVDLNIAVGALLEVRLEGTCPRIRTVEISLSGGSAPFPKDLLDIFGRATNCFDLPAPLQAVDLQIEEGRLIDLGGGRIGAVITGSVSTLAPGIVEAARLLEADGTFDQ